MDKRKLMLLLGAMVVALGSALAVRSVMAGRVVPAVRAAVIAPTGPRVLVALRALPIGTLITPDAVAYQTWPKDMVKDAYFLDGKTDKAKLIGTVVRYPVTAGQPVTQGALVAPGDRGFLAAALTPGMRAVTIPVSDMTGVAGFIFPGDHVDMMLTQSVKAADQSGTNALPLAATETVLRNLRVLATDQATETEVAPGGKSVAKVAHAVTLEVTPRIAEKIEVAQTLGSLSLALRSLADDQGQPKLGSGGRAVPIAVYRPDEGPTTFSTGGDVSRFARRSVPGPGRRTAVPMAVPHMTVARGNSESAVPLGTVLVARMPGMSGSAGAMPLQTPMVGGQ